MSSSDANSPGRLILRLFGAPRIELDGEPVALGRRKAVALLAYLAVTAERHRRDSLVNLLWPDSDSTRGRAALRRTLFALNRALAGDWLDVDRTEMGLPPGADVWVDVRAFDQKLALCAAHGHPSAEACADCVAPLTEAVELARGDFMAGFSLRDSVNFDDWQVYQAEALRRELGDALERLVKWYGGQRQFEPAVRFARRKLALDPLDEAAHRELMRLYAWSGKRSAALSQYDECVAVLEDQLGLPPQIATEQLYGEIKAGRVPQLDARRPQSVPAAEPPAFLESDEAPELPFFAAREGELARLNAFLEQTLAGQGGVVFVTGEAGSGKTALVQEFIWQAEEAHTDLLAAAGNCNAYTGIGDPYLPFREILQLLAGDVEARWAAGAMSAEHARRLWNALPVTSQALVDSGLDLVDTFLARAPFLERAATWAQLAGSRDWAMRLSETVDRKPLAPGIQTPQQSLLFEQYTRVLQALAGRGPLLLVVDDLQWADLGSISLLFHLGRSLRGSRILVVGAYRPEEVAVGLVAPGREEAGLPEEPGSRQAGRGHRHPLEVAVNELQRELGDIVVDVDKAERRGFVEALLDSEPNRLGPDFREMLHRQTHGHPLFTIELLRGMQDRGDLARDAEGRWVEGPALDWDTLPARVEAAIAERFGRLSRPAQAVLRVASVEGEEFTAEVVAQVLGASERDLVSSLSSELDRGHRLVRAQSIRRMGSRRMSRYRFRNFLFQKYIYDGLDEVERTYLHEDVGYAVEGLFADRVTEMPAVAPELARHFLEAGLAEKAVHYLKQAGENALHLSAYEDGIDHLTRGLALLRTLPDSRERDQQELELQLVLSIAWQGPKGAQSPEVERASNRARELCQKLGKTSQLCRVVGELATMYFVRAEVRKAVEMAEESLKLARQTEDPLLVAMAHWYLGVALFSRGEHAPARAHLKEVIDFYRPKEHHQAFVLLRGSDAGLGALAYDACCLWSLGYPDQAKRRGDEALSLARELGHPFSTADVVCFAGCTLSGMRRDALALKERAQELMRLATEKTAVWLASAQCYLGGALVVEGRAEAALVHMRDVMPAIQERGAICHMSETLSFSAQAQALAERPDEALATLAEALAFVEESEQRHLEPELHRLTAEMHLMMGDEAGAESSLHNAIDVARRQQARSWELRAAMDLARLWQARGKVEQARRMLSAIYAWFTEGFDTRDLREAKALLEELA